MHERASGRTASSVAEHLGSNSRLARWHPRELGCYVKRLGKMRRRSIRRRLFAVRFYDYHDYLIHALCERGKAMVQGVRCEFTTLLDPNSCGGLRREDGEVLIARQDTTICNNTQLGYPPNRVLEASWERREVEVDGIIGP